jgi:hypothetical protein
MLVKIERPDGKIWLNPKHVAYVKETIVDNKSFYYIKTVLSEEKLEITLSEFVSVLKELKDDYS